MVSHTRNFLTMTMWYLCKIRDLFWQGIIQPLFLAPCEARIMRDNFSSIYVASPALIQVLTGNCHFKILKVAQFL
jgi:hypothetical protein